MRSGYFLIALVLAVNGAGCAQVKKAVNKESLADRVALRITEVGFVEGVLKEAKMHLNNVNVSIEPLDVPLDVKLARILVHDFAEDPHLLQTEADLFELCAEHATNVEEILVKDNKHLDDVLKVAAMAAEARNKSMSDINNVLLMENLEIQNNDRITPQKATLIRQTAEKLPSIRSRKTVAVLEQFRMGVTQAITRHPELLQPFSEEKPRSEALRTSRARVQKLLQSAK